MQLNGNRQFIIPIDMKKTIHVNIGGMPFVLDEDAYDVLKRYLSEIEIRLDGVDDQETMQDIETRIAARSPPACRWWTRRSSNGPWL